MAKQVINTGTAANDNTGDSIKAALDKANSNFTELYDDLPDTTDALLQGTTNLYNQTHTGDVTGSTALTIASGVVSNSNLASDLKGSTTVTGNNIDCSLAKVYDVTLTSTSSIGFNNDEVGMQKILIVDPDGNTPNPVFTAGNVTLEGTFNASTTNYIIVDIISTSATPLRLIRIYN